MKKNKFLMAWCIVCFLASAIAYFYLPEVIPTHWGVSGEIDGYGPKSTIFIIGALPLFIYFFLNVLPKIDPKAENYKKHESAYSAIMSIIIIILSLMEAVIIVASLGYKFDINLVIGLIIAVMFIAIGNYLPQTRSNYFFGVKTPWTLASEVVWRKTHKTGGYLFSVLGLIILASTLFLRTKLAYVILVSIACITIGLFAYSYFEYVKVERKKDQK